MAVSKSAYRLSVAASLLVAAVIGLPALAQTTTAYAEKAARIQEMRNAMPTQAQREAAAAELKAFKLKVEQAKKAALKAGLSRPTNIQLPPGVAGPQPGGFPDYYTTSNWAFSPPLKKFVDTLPGLTAAGANNRGKYIPVATPDTITYPGSDYYEISAREYQHSFHSELPATTVRGYVQTNNGTDGSLQNTVQPSPISWLGPIIVAQRDRPVRIKFTNELPIGEAGNLHVPVDTTIMGSGPGPLWPASMYGQPNPAGGPVIDATTPCDASPTASVPPGNATHGPACAEYTQNRVAIHLHGGRTPWISDGTPHQWIIPKDEWPNTPYKEGVSLENVPDMPNPGPGATTYYYSNQQSARLMFYHDHAWGITRLNVMEGVAAGYLITDEFESGLVASNAIPADQIPLVIQDRTFVAEDVRTNDPTWNWGTGAKDANGVRAVHVGDMWIPHVYVPAQNPYDPSGVNPFGRWVYGPWFFPPTTNIMWNVVPNPYHDPACSDPDPAVYAFCTTPGQAVMVPGTPQPSVGAESFLDTAMVNGQAFPSLTVEPKAYRFRILNAANDRFWNLNLYKADPAQVSHDLRTNTEVKMVAAASTAFDTNLYPNWPTDGRTEGVPDPATQGPPFIQIGTEGGFLPRPVVVPAQPITFVTDPTAFNVGNVADFGLFLGPAERADVIVDFSAYAGQTLILYNDAPAAVPAFDPRHDFLTGAPDLSDTGGYGRPAPWDPTGPKQGPQIGYGPNTRTVMQIKVAATGAAPAFNLANLEAAFAPNPATAKKGVFEQAQDPVIVGQDAYNGAYTAQNGSLVQFPKVWPYWGFSRIDDQSLPVFTPGGTYETFFMEPKGMHDEMGASFDMEYGRMSTNLGITNTQRVVGMLNLTVYKYPDPATEILNDAGVPGIAKPGDGTQIWKISHNGVDTHPIHFHIFDVQVINRVGWDGQIRPPHPTELGWKDTVRISPLEDTIVAMRPWAPKLPFGVPDSLRVLNPSLPLNATYGFTNIDPVTQQPKANPDVNRVDNFGWEYVWHCHILSHEENDMMRPVVLNVVSALPGAPGGLAVTPDIDGRPVLSWTDPTQVDYLAQSNFGNTANEIAFRIERTSTVGVAPTVMFALANTESFTDTTAVAGTYYRYRVVAYNEAGEAAAGPVEFGTAGSANAASSVNLSALPASGFVQVIPGTPVVFTAQGVGGTGAYEYQFTVNAAVVQGWSAAATYTMPVTTTPGTYAVRVDVRTSAASASDAFATLSYVWAVPATAGLTLAAAPGTSPVYFGTPVLYTATGTGSAGYQYRFWLDSGSGYGAVPAQDWSALLNTFTLPATAAPGTYKVKAEVRTTTSVVDAFQEVTTVVRYRPATGVSLRSSVASPLTLTTPVTPVSFLALGSGSTGTPSLGYQYRYLTSADLGVTYTEVQGWSTNKIWNLPTPSKAGAYYVKVECRTDSTAAAEASATTIFRITYGIQPATAVTLTPDLASPQNPGTAVTFTAAATGTTAPVSYRYWKKVGAGAWAIAQDWGTSTTYVLPNTTPLGSYTLAVEARTDVRVGTDATSAQVPFTVAWSAPTGGTLTTDLPSPQNPGTAVTFTAQGLGSSSYSYRFWSTKNGISTMVRDWSATPTWVMPTTTAIGTYTIQAEVRAGPAGGTVVLTNTVVFAIGWIQATGVTLSASPPNGANPGTAVTFTAQGQGSSGYLYRFWKTTNGVATMVRDWSTTQTWVMDGTTPIGTHSIQVEVNVQPGTSRDALSNIINYKIDWIRATGVTLSASLPSPQNPGTAVTFTAQGQGSSGYQYRFWRTTGGAATMVRNWSTTPTWVMPNTTPIGVHTITVEVRVTSALGTDAVSSPFPFEIKILPATGVSLTANPANAAPFGTPVDFTAQGTGTTAPMSYRFWWSTNGGTNWSVVRDWSTTQVWTMPGSTPKGTYLIGVEVRTGAVQDAAAPNMTYFVQ